MGYSGLRDSAVEQDTQVQNNNDEASQVFNDDDDDLTDILNESWMGQLKQLHNDNLLQQNNMQLKDVPILYAEQYVPNTITTKPPGILKGIDQNNIVSTRLRPRVSFEV